MARKTIITTIKAQVRAKTTNKIPNFEFHATFDSKDKETADDVEKILMVFDERAKRGKRQIK